MRFFLDTPNINEIRGAGPLAIVDGLTTNPSLVAKEGKSRTSPPPSGGEDAAGGA